MDGSRIAAAADDETLRLYTSAGELVWSTKTDDDLVSVAISPNGTYIAGGTSAGNVLLFSAEGGEERWTYGLSRQPVTSVAVADNARTIAAVSEDGAFSLISRAGSLLQSGSAPPHAGGVSVTADGACAAVADRQGIRFIERDGTMKNHIKGVDASVAAAMDGDGMLIAVTDGARISGFMWNSGAAPEEAESTAGGAIDNEPNAPPAAAVTSTPEEAPVSTHSPPFPLVPAIAGLFFQQVSRQWADGSGNNQYSFGALFLYSLFLCRLDLPPDCTLTATAYKPGRFGKIDLFFLFPAADQGFKGCPIGVRAGFDDGHRYIDDTLHQCGENRGGTDDADGAVLFGTHGSDDHLFHCVCTVAVDAVGCIVYRIFHGLEFVQKKLCRDDCDKVLLFRVKGISDCLHQ